MYISSKSCTNATRENEGGKVKDDKFDPVCRSIEVHNEHNLDLCTAQPDKARFQGVLCRPDSRITALSRPRRVHKGTTTYMVYYLQNGLELEGGGVCV